MKNPSTIANPLIKYLPAFAPGKLNINFASRLKCLLTPPALKRLVVIAYPVILKLLSNRSSTKLTIPTILYDSTISGGERRQASLAAAFCGPEMRWRKFSVAESRSAFPLTRPNIESGHHVEELLALSSQRQQWRMTNPLCQSRSGSILRSPSCSWLVENK